MVPGEGELDAVLDANRGLARAAAAAACFRILTGSVSCEPGGFADVLNRERKIF